MYSEETRSCGEFRYRLQQDGTAELTEYTGSETVLEIPAALDGVRVARIGPEAFKRRLDLREVIIPAGVVSIGYQAFFLCAALTRAALPEGLQRIEEEAFCLCVSLEAITIPASVTRIGPRAFNTAEYGFAEAETDKDLFEYQLVLTVSPGSYAEAFCRQTGLRFAYPDGPAPA